MDFSLSAEQEELKAAAVDFAGRELDKDLAEREEAGEFSPQAWRACAKFGIQGLPVPAEPGGGGADIVATAQLPLLYITNAPVADVVLVFARDPDKPKMAGISALRQDRPRLACGAL